MALRIYRKFHNELFAAPAIDVEIQSKKTGESIVLNMLIDTGSSRTVLPLSVIENHLKNEIPISDTTCISYDNMRVVRPIYVLDFVILDNHFKNIEVIGVKERDKDFGLIGRNIFTYHNLHCYGKDQKFNLEYQK